MSRHVQGFQHRDAGFPPRGRAEELAHLVREVTENFRVIDPKDFRILA
jgi:hypothetical protein